MRYLILTLFMALSFGADTGATIPSDLREAARIHNDKIMEIDNKAARLKGEVGRETLERFDALVKKYTRNGDLEGALLAKKMGAELVEKCDNVGEKLLLSSTMSEKAADFVVGAWKVTHSNRSVLKITYAKGGTVVASSGISGNWAISADARVCRITWSNGVEYTMILEGKGETFKGMHSEAGPITWVRNKE